jgi:lipase maturation factor 1
VRSWKGTAILAPVAIVLVPLSLVPFLPFLPALRPLARAAAPADRVMDALRSVNAYHLFASMTVVRREPVIEGSNDGVTWLPYEFRYKPGDVDRPPPFVAPHQPRVDFQLWFLLLGRHGAQYFDTLLERMLHDPAAVASLFTRNPFPDAPPAELRVAVYRYRFSDRETRRTTGAWWTRELEGYARPTLKRP